MRFLFVGEQRNSTTGAPRVRAAPFSLNIIVFDRSVRIKHTRRTALYFDDFLALGKKPAAASEVENLLGAEPTPMTSAAFSLHQRYHRRRKQKA